MINEHLSSFAGLPIHSLEDEAPQDVSQVAWRVGLDYDMPESEFKSGLDEVLERTGTGGPATLVLGSWGEPYESAAPLQLLIDRAGRMGGLRSLFVGDIVMEEAEISWIEQGDYTPLLAAFPQLERLWIRGGTGLTIQPLSHGALVELVVQAGGTPPEFVRAISRSELPQLKHLELWLGTEDYAGGATVADLEPILSGQIFPAMTRLGLRNAENADEVAVAVATAPVVSRLKELDLSLGTLGDAGAQALLTGQPLTHLDKLDLQHHFMSAEMARRVVETLAPTQVDVSDVQTEDESEDEKYRRFISVSE